MDADLSSFPLPLVVSCAIASRCLARFTIDEIPELASWFVSMGTTGDRRTGTVTFRTSSFRWIDHRTAGVASLLLRLLGFPSRSCGYPWACNIATQMCSLFVDESRELLSWTLVVARYSLSRWLGTCAFVRDSDDPCPWKTMCPFLGRVMSRFMSCQSFGRVLFPNVWCPDLCPVDPPVGCVFRLHCVLIYVSLIHGPDVFVIHVSFCSASRRPLGQMCFSTVLYRDLYVPPIPRLDAVSRRLAP